jgi:hypothetical protein
MCIKFVYINSKSTVQNIVSYNREVFWKFTCARTVRDLAVDRLRHQGEPRTGTLQKHTLTLWTVRRRSEHCARPSADRLASSADCPTIEKPDKPEGDGFGKMHFYRPRRPSGVHGQTIRDCSV